MALPNGYTRLKYIQSTGTQYIDTRFKANNNTRLVIDMQMTDTSVNNQWLYGARDATKKNSFGFYWYNDAFGVNYGTGQNSIAVPSEATDRLFIDHNKNVVSFNGATSTITTATWSGAYNLALLAVNTTGTTGNNVRAKLYSCQIYNNSTLIRDFVPCKNSSGVVGLYDVVNGAFYENKGSGTFVAGAELVPEYKTVDATMLDTALSATADAIRAKTGRNDGIPWNESSGFASEVLAIEGGSTAKLQSKTATPSASSQTIKPDSGYDGLSQVTVNAMPTATQATPSITVSTGGLITASATQPAGYVATGTKSATKQLTAQAAKTVTPGTSDQTAVASGVYTTGAITVKGDANLKAENIAKDVSIFGITGTHSGGGNVATGYVVISYTTRYKFTVTGLGFTPSNVLLMYDAYGRYGGTGTGLGFSSSIGSAVLGFAAGDYNMWQFLDATGTMLFGEDFTTAYTQYIDVTFANGSFTAQTASNTNYKFIVSGVYRYVAW